MLTKPSVALHKYTLDATSGPDSYQLATSAREIIAIIVTAEGSGISVGIYDTDNGSINPASAIFISANAGSSTPFTPNQNIPFDKGIFIRIEQGGDPFNGKIFILAN